MNTGESFGAVFIIKIRCVLRKIHKLKAILVSQQTRDSNLLLARRT